MDTINQLLGLSPEEFEKERFGYYWKWCEKLTTNILEAQKILANSSINRYYNIELAKCEKEFLFRIRNYQDSETITAKDRKRLYEKCIQVMEESRKPMSLIENVIRAKPKEMSLSISIAYVAVRGVKLDSITLRLN
ncbi:hypothetical protein OIU83_17650 [Flavobacterium sp. LS1R49]|uniref:Uncharacterized protein n=1 Tax=Flavobacterium shii TaxID=2987687 RepID=A0A9X2ZHK3_9FLAO|nr:hypothetical protein [Flavobacterium shii]MCV9929490.1 hypothetical protein [Flavobacterium shii]